MVKRGDIFIMDLEPTRGSEQGGIRPCLTIQNNTGNKNSRTTIIAPITSKRFEKSHPIHVRLDKGQGNLDKDSTILLNHIRVVDKTRLIKKLGSLDLETMKRADKAIKISLDLD